MVKLDIKHVLTLKGRERTRFAFFLCLSILAHSIVFIFLLSTSLPRMGAALPRVAKPEALIVNFIPVHNERHELMAEVFVANEETLPAEPESVDSVMPEASSDVEYEENDAGSTQESIATVKYYSLSELDEIPKTQTPIDMASLDLFAYPNGGEVELRVWVDEYGEVVGVESTQSEMPPAFIERAKELFMQAKFFPGMVNHEPVKFVSKIVIRYESPVSSGISNMRRLVN